MDTIEKIYNSCNKIQEYLQENYNNINGKCSITGLHMTLEFVNNELFYNSRSLNIKNNIQYLLNDLTYFSKNYNNGNIKDLLEKMLNTLIKHLENQKKNINLLLENEISGSIDEWLRKQKLQSFI